MRPPRQKVWLAFFGSVLLHGIALVLFALIVTLRPPAPPVPTPDEPIQLEVVQEEPTATPPPLPDAVPTPTATPKLVVDAAGLDADSSPAPGALLSERSTRASSSEQSEKNPPGTTQAGRRMASFQFDPRPPAPGIVARNDPPAPTPLPETAPELPKPDRTAARPSPPPRRSVATPPPPATPAPTAVPDQFAMAMATPPPLPEDPFDPSIRSTSPPLPKPVTRSLEKSTPPPSVGAMRSAENGSAPLGPGGIDTVATPAGRYTRKVADMIKFIWYRSIESRDDVMYGSVVIHCTIDRDGLVIQPRVATNTADPLFASTALQAVVVARLPAMPDEVLKELEGKRLPMDITFERSPMPQGSSAH